METNTIFVAVKNSYGRFTLLWVDGRDLKNEPNETGKLMWIILFILRIFTLE